MKLLPTSGRARMRRLRSSLSAASLLLLVVVAGCGGRSAGARFLARDSAGVRVATTSTLDAPEWRLDSLPRLDLGTVNAEGPRQFYRVSGLLRLADGSVVVANAGSSELRFFGADGGFVRSVGREGDGPGEFRSLSGLWKVAGDSLFVWDGRNRRVSVLDVHGDFVRAFELKVKLLNGSVVTVYPDGRVMTGDLYLDFGKGGPGKDAQPIWMRYALTDHDGVELDTLPRQLNSMMVLLGDAEHRLIGSALFGPRTQTAGDTHGYWVGLTKTEEIMRYSPDGTLVELLRWPGGDRTVGKDDVERAHQKLLEGRTGDQAKLSREIFATQPVADVFPSHGRLVARDDGELWVQAYEPPYHTGPSRWMVFDTTGALAARVSTPASFTVMEVGADYVLGVFRDEMDVEHVRLYRLRRTASN